MSGGDGVGFSIDPTTVREWKRYPEYTDSGVDWIGEVPAGWETSSIKRHFSVQLGKMLQNQPNGPGDTLRPYLRAANISWGKVLIDDLKEMWFSESEKAQYRIEKGDLLVSEGGDVGRAALWNDELDECYIQNAINRVRSRNGALSSHLYYWTYFLKHVGYIDTLCNKATIAHYTAEKVMNTVYLCPPLPEQHAIAAFLDRETARIDALIAKKRRFIELLEEKRQALITQAVTKGLDPDVEMKDSGVEWLGEVPVGWEVVKNGILIDSIEQGWSPLAENRIAEEDEWAVIKLNAVSKGRFYPLEHKVLSTDYDGKDNWKINTGDFLITRSNTPDLVGDVCLVDSIGNRKLIISDLVYKLNYCLRSVNPLFMKYWMLSKAGRYQIVRDARGSSRSMVKISQEIVKSWYVLLPPLPEQHAIATFLDRETAQIDTLINAITRQIEKLHEYRTALISAAVTGKIDVRGEVPADP